ncbi:amidase [Bradyrhizobium guangdongense]|nr:amidase [Bradyrhizobium guangdongense]GGI32908.1 amidase [Bradyrhizobium guangdongense]
MATSSDEYLETAISPGHARTRRAITRIAQADTAAIHYWSATRLARAIRQKQIGCAELLAAFLSRIEKHNPRLTAIVDLDLAGARKQAEAADAALARDSAVGPLHGIPMTVKDSVDVAGLASTWGFGELKNNRPAKSAQVVEALTEAGAIVFGKTNVPLGLLSWETFNDVFGTTNNPWDVTCSPGGSSGGAAAALAAGLSALELGSDSAGSSRGPAHYCGIYAHKPTYGVVSIEGQSLPGVGSVPDIMVLGPMARSAEDLAVALDVMAGPDEAKAAAWRVTLPRSRLTKLSEFKVAIMSEHDGYDVDREVQARLDELGGFLSRRGAHVSSQARPEIDFDAAHRLCLNLICASAAGAIPEPYWTQLTRMARLTAARVDSELTSVIRGYTQSHREWIRNDQVRRQLQTTWGSFFRDYDVLLTPVAATAALPHDQSSRIDRFRKIVVNGKRVPATDQWFWAGLPAAAYLPATIAPIGFTSAGLPVGVQIIGPQYSDHTCLSFAHLLEQEYHSFVPPPGWN